MDALNIRSKLKYLIEKADKMIERGDCDDCSDEKLEQITNLIDPEIMCRTEAAKYLGISLNHFHELINEGKLSGKKHAGFKEKCYRLDDLKKVKDKLDKN